MIRPVAPSRGDDWTSSPRLGARPSVLSERYAGWLDAAIVAGILLLSLPWWIRHSQADAVLVVVFSLLLAVPLLWRRRAPFPVFAVLATVALVQWFVLHPVFADFALLVGLYTVTARESRARVLTAAGVLELGVLLALLGNIRPSANLLVALIMMSGLVIAAVVLGLNVRMRAAYLREIEERARRLEVERDQQAQLATAAERTRIARELHDIVAHNLSVMIALSDGAALSLDSNPVEARRALTEAATSGRRAMVDLRQVLGVLRGHGDDPELAPAPTLADVDDLVRAARDTGLRVEIAFRGDVGALPGPLQLSVYRIVQESLTNAIKHARASTRVRVEVEVAADAVRVTVADDGEPAPSETVVRPGHGLAGMRERAALHDGTLSAGVTPTGWTVRATLPRSLPAAADAVRPAVLARRGTR
ncbi:sensor histidine kinase [Allobranchiibius sp. CTAmp26]|uniref:sensor histidine kinase n=1 Tax=Allobranchiibius sp. CTAmp26 TaxID=2815214 RepID=UPI001AA0C3F4|nr:histidine kinase [Allobranchiibius sp. CTAmp26]MBO1756237.1 ATP-binding protein [Allobranchiibius sp. CTAmp26]